MIKNIFNKELKGRIIQYIIKGYENYKNKNKIIHEENETIN
jgi:hypothetical protein